MAKSPSAPLYLLSRVRPFYAKYWFRVTVGIVFSVLMGSLDAVMPLGIKTYMELFLGGTFANGLTGSAPPTIGPAVQLDASQFSVWAIPLAIMAFTLLQGIMGYTANYCNNWVGLKVTSDVRAFLYEKILRFEPGYFDTTTSGELLERACHDVIFACSDMVYQVKIILTRSFSALALIGTLLFLSWKLALIAVLSLSLTILPVTRIRKRLKWISNEKIKLGGVVHTHYNETVGGNRVIMAYSLHERQRDKLIQSMAVLVQNQLKTIKLEGWITPLMHTLTGLGVGLVLLYGTSLMQSGELTPASFSAFLAALIMLYNPIKGLGHQFLNFQRSLFAVERVFKLADRPSKIKENPDAAKLTTIGRGVELDNVSFHYVQETPVLQNLSLRIEPGQTVALVGASGSGKSTIASLIPRFYDVSEGAVRIDGHDVRNLTLASLREQISMVFQDNFLFHDTLRENITLGATVSDDALQEALDGAHLSEFIASLPEGVETSLGERGVTLSGGQRQRVAIARALVKNAPMVILDEATSALDNQSEALVQEALDRLMQGRTVLVIAHRLSTIQNADVIVVMDQGQVVEQGQHDELLALNGQYRQLFEAQFRLQTEHAQPA